MPILILASSRSRSSVLVVLGRSSRRRRRLGRGYLLGFQGHDGHCVCGSVGIDPASVTNEAAAAGHQGDEYLKYQNDAIFILIIIRSPSSSFSSPALCPP